MIQKVSTWTERFGPTNHKIQTEESDSMGNNSVVFVEEPSFDMLDIQ